MDGTIPIYNSSISLFLNREIFINSPNNTNDITKPIPEIERRSFIVIFFLAKFHEMMVFFYAGAKARG